MARQLPAVAPLLLALCGVLVGTALWLTVPSLGRTSTASAWVAVLVCLAFVATNDEKATLRFEMRRHSFGVVLTDIPLVFSFFLLPPWAAFAANAVAVIIGYAIRRGDFRRVAFNSSLFLLCSTIALAVFHLGAAPSSASSESWAFAYAALAAASAVSTVGVYLVIALVQGPPTRSQALIMTVNSLATAAVSGTVALAALMLIGINPWSGAIVGVLIVTLAVAYRGYSNSLREKRALSELYDFTTEVGAQASEGGLADVVLEQTRLFLRAETATLWLPAVGQYPELVLTARVDEGVLDEAARAPDAIRSGAMSGMECRLVSVASTEDPKLLRALSDRGVDEVIVTPLRSGSRIIGVLEVATRLGDGIAFGPEDARLLQTLAAHAGVAVENSRLVDQLRHDANHDALTGLPNRRRFSAALDEAIAIRPAPDEVVAVALLDLDSFKDVNDTLGHGAGDRLLIEVGRRLGDAAPQGSLLARMGGDEFVFLLRLPNAAAARREGTALLAALSDPVDMEGLSIDVGGSVGIALFPDHGIDGGTLLQRAEVAMYSAKGAVRQVRIYQPTMDSLSIRRLALVGELRRAIEDRQLTVYYQPQVGLADQQLIGVEALVRWQHPEQGIISPDDFVPIAEHTGLIAPLTSFVLETALRQCRRWMDEGRHLNMAVNLSVRSLVDPDFADEVAGLLERTGVPSDLLTLEITESGVMSDMDRSLPTLHALRDMGIKLSVDDFGTGQSSLTYLRRLPVTEVKIAKQFVLNMGTDSGDCAVVRAIVDLGRHLNLNVVAEGVETEMSYQLLRDMECDVAQGFLLSRPVPIERFETWIRARTVQAPAAAETGQPWLRVVNG